ncbi:MAG TPA: DegV family protein [Anaerolineaceae bacterium]|nr:DegV family protein [Anaerolineaceae bacterium]
MIKIIADTLSCIPPAEAHDLGIAYVPQIIQFGADESYRDDSEIDSATFLKKLRLASSLPQTAAPPPALYTHIYEQYAAEGHTMLVICPSAQVSGTFRSAEVAAQDFPQADIRIIDTKSIASSLGQMVRLANEWASQGVDADSIVARVNEMATRDRIMFIVDTLEYLQKGGRIGKARAFVGSLLQVKPILAFHDGQTEPVEQQRTKRRAIARLCELVLETCPRSPESYISILQGDALDDAEFLAEYFKKCLGITNIPIFFLPPAILVHSGPGAVGVSYFVAR